MPTQTLRAGIALVVLAGIAAWAWTLSAEPSARGLVFSLLTGTAFGIVLQRARFCFLCNFRDFWQDRDPRGLISIAVALAVGTLLYHAVMMAWAPVPQPDRLPPNAHVGPVGFALAVAAFVFGIGMAISGSCLSAHFYRLGEGSPTSPFAIVGALAGFLLGFLTWNPIYLASISESRAIWLPHALGYSGTLALTLVVLAAIVVALAVFGRWEQGGVQRGGLRPVIAAIFRDRWPPVIGGIAVGVISAVYYFRVAPLGVTAELGSIARTAGSAQGLLPDTLFGLDGLRGCATVVKETVLSPNGLLVVGLILGSFASALAAGQFKPALPTGGQVAKGLVGGVLMGWGAMTALGCTVGVLLSGIHAGALSGWVFLAFCALGVWLGLAAMTRLFPAR
ncbi:MAG: YeeE/YedE family protein [Rhizobiaceae bacterium]|nr:YeeE/YedE family protein [Rhizobiaceae bacterium]